VVSSPPCHPRPRHRLQQELNAIIVGKKREQEGLGEPVPKQAGGRPVGATSQAKGPTPGLVGGGKGSVGLRNGAGTAKQQAASRGCVAFDHLIMIAGLMSGMGVGGVQARRPREWAEHEQDARGGLPGSGH
jgi:hypothetical protein